jgi:ADP-heptose:LPS heptosyltransferase
MINYLLRRRLQNFRGQEGEITPRDLEAARKVLFALFCRYGDAIISLSVINEFIEKYPDKKYFLVTSHQMYPYAHKLLGDRVTIMSFNKRKNPLKLLKIISLLKREKIELGFNPWGSGDDSKFIISYADKFIFYTGFHGISNLYDRVRDYLGLEKEERLRLAWNLDNINRIVICPFSTAMAKSLVNGDLQKLLRQVRQRFPDAEITMAVPPPEAQQLKGRGKILVFRKTKTASAAFLQVLEAADLVISVDAGPLHLADKLGLRTIGIFGPTTPQGVLDRVTRVVALREETLAGFFCGVKCHDPRCIHRLFQGDFLERQVKDYGAPQGETWELGECRLR